MAAKIPSLAAPAVDGNGQFTNEWVGFFTSLTGAPGAIVNVTPTGSPFSYTAPARGNLVLMGGAVGQVTITRGRATVAVPASAIPALASGDAVSITYSSMPNVTFVPA